MFYYISSFYIYIKDKLNNIKMTKHEKYSGWLSYLISIILLIVSFIIPPEGIIDSSVLMAVSILLAGHQLIFGSKIKEVTIDKNGFHMITKDDIIQNK